MHGGAPSDESRPDPAQMRVWRRMSPAQKIAIVDELRTFAMSTKRESLRRAHPDWDGAMLERSVRRWFLVGEVDS